jgi:hypothetical protein
MTKTKPTFAAWSHQNLANFASEAFDDMAKKAEEIELLTADNKLLLEALRKLWLESN